MTRLVMGSIVPSSNAVVERTLAALVPLFPGLDSCVARIPFHGAGLGQPRDGYGLDTFRTAATLLGHAGPGVVCWNGTRGAALGLAHDRALCAELAEAAGCPATTAALATLRLLDRLGARRIAIVTPGDAAGARATAAGLGRELVGLRAMALTDNAAAAAVPPNGIAALARDVAAEARPEAILLWSTNLFGLPVMAPVEAETGIPVIDSASAGVWGGLDALGLDPTPAAGLGRLFSLR